MKKLAAAVLVAITVAASVPCVSYAEYSSTISVEETGNRSDLIYIKRPESLNASTSDKTYTISAVGSQGTVVKVYRYNPSTGVCSIIRNGTKIGASGLYSTVVDLNSASNTFVVTAENSLGSQAVRIEIDKIKQSTVDKLKTVTVTIKNFFDR